MRRLLLAFGFICLPCSPLQADADAEETRLLKSWGMQFNAEGKLFFRTSPADEIAANQPWNPDVSQYESKPPERSEQALQPVVISSKQPADK